MNQDSTRSKELVAVSIRIPENLREDVAITAIRRKTTARQLWIDAMREYLGERGAAA